MLSSACVDNGPDTGQGCDGAKCDDPNGTPTAHATAVLDCDQALAEALAVAGESLPLTISARKYFADCLVGADNGAIATIEENLLESGAPLRSREEIAIAYDEYRYASLCIDIESASTLTGDALDSLIATCEASRERSLAQVIGAIVDFGEDGNGWELEEERETFADCYAAYDEAMTLSESPAAKIAAQEFLAFCAATTLHTQALPLMEARCEQENCFDELLALTFVQAGFETAIITSDRMCQLLVDSSSYQRQGAPEQLISCRMTAYSGLATQVLAGLP